MRIGWVLVACLACSRPKQEAPSTPIGSAATTPVDAVASAPADTAARPDAAVPAGPQLYTDAELAALEASLMTYVSANPGRTCTPAPVLHGETKPGDGTAELIALVEPTGEYAKCTSRLEKLTNVPDLFEKRDPAVLAVAKECGTTVETAVLAAASHVNGCSPYQTGVRHRADDQLVYLRGINILGMHARLRAESGDPVGALWSLVSGLRVAQDLTRGHIDLLATVVVGAAYKILVNHALAIIVGTKLPADALTPLVTAIDALLAAEPRFGGAVVGEDEHMGLFMALAGMKPADWEPPGGTSEEQRKDRMDPASVGASSLSARDLGGLLLSATLMQYTAHTKACPESVTYAACAKGLADEEAQRAKKTSDSKVLRDPFALLGELAKTKTPEQARLEVQRLIRDTLVGIAMPSFVRYVNKKGHAVAGLVALRMALELEKSGVCKPVAVPSANVVLGTPVRTTVTGTQLDVRWAPDADKLQWTVQCP